MKKARLVLSFVIIIVLIISITGCSKVKKYEKQLVGTWYREGEYLPSFSLYNDGTCISHEYSGTGHWSVYEENGAIKMAVSESAYPDEDDAMMLVGVGDHHFTVQDDDGTTYNFWN